MQREVTKSAVIVIIIIMKKKVREKKNNVTWRMRDRRFGGWAYGGLSLNSRRGEHMRQSRLQFGFIRAWFHRTIAG
jgi:hypothetical protein